MSYGEVQERIKQQLGIDIMVALEERRKLSDQAAALREVLAPYRAKYRGGTASPYDQERKVKIAEIVERLRVEFAAREEKASETRLDTVAHASPEYLEWLREERTHSTQMHVLEAKLYGIEEDISEWDKLTDMARTMTHYLSSELRNL